MSWSYAREGATETGVMAFPMAGMVLGIPTRWTAIPFKLKKSDIVVTPPSVESIGYAGLLYQAE